MKPPPMAPSPANGSKGTDGDSGTWPWVGVVVVVVAATVVVVVGALVVVVAALVVVVAALVVVVAALVVVVAAVVVVVAGGWPPSGAGSGWMLLKTKLFWVKFEGLSPTQIEHG
jgi:hypothetical protein